MIIEKNDLSSMLRISDPFLMLDKLIDISPGLSGIGIKEIKRDEWFFLCHFIDEPIMPGTLQSECMLQTLIGIIYSDVKTSTRNCLVVKNSVNLYSKITQPGTIKVEGRILSIGNGGIQAKAKLFFRDNVVSDGVFRFIIPENLKINK